ncbi:hypothetical protein EDB89DRAFT_336496 [Lactarius sanguifluus]|nr:hypothetical protein EDB89DRAFT_336496 [Lactarius sanguifluus]
MSSSGAIPAPTQHGHSTGMVAQCPDNYGHTTAINMLPVDILLKIFDFCRIDSSRLGISFHPRSEWPTLVHVCQQWRQIVFASPRRLDLVLLCTYGTPVRKNLAYWPPLPIVVDYFTWNGTGRAPNYEDDATAALEHPDRVRSIKLAVTNSRLGRLASVVQEPFPSLTDLWLSSKDRNAPVLPDVFLDGSAPRLQKIYLAGLSFPALPTLLLSASDLVYLRLHDIPQNGYITPEAMVTGLAALPRLDTLWIWFKSQASRVDQRHSPLLLPRNVLPSLLIFNFCGFSEYLEDFLARIDTPRLHCFKITYFNRLDFRVPQLSQFITRTENFELTGFRHARVRFNVGNAFIKLDSEQGEHRINRITVRILCKGLDWQVSHLAQILGQSPVMVSNVDRLSIDEDDLQSGWQDYIDDTKWLQLLRPFTAVKTLHGSEQLGGHIALALDDISGEMVAEVLPALDSLWLDDQPAGSVEQFIAVRRVSGHPVIFAGDN